MVAKHTIANRVRFETDGMVRRGRKKAAKTRRARPQVVEMLCDLRGAGAGRTKRAVNKIARGTR
jgi:hypothetical protein